MKSFKVAGLFLIGLSLSVVEAFANTASPSETNVKPSEKIEDRKARPKMSNEITTQDTAIGTKTIPGKKKVSRRTEIKTDIKEKPVEDIRQ